MNTADEGVFRVQASAIPVDGDPASIPRGWQSIMVTLRWARRVRDTLRGEGVPGCALGVPVEVRSADEAGEDPKGKSKQAEPGRPAIYIE